MRIDLLTLFPEMFVGPLTESLIQRARDRKILDIAVHDIRSFATDKHRSADDRAFGGGPGMVMKIEPIYGALQSVGAVRRRAKASKKRPLVIYLSPQGERFDQRLAEELVGHGHLVLLCGHYEGIDERAMQWVDREVSIGDYVLTGGELPAMVLIDCVARLLPGVVKEAQSVEQDSFSSGLLDYPHYTRPTAFQGLAVPDILLSGHHAKILEWRRRQSLERTFRRRPELLKRFPLSPEDKSYIAQLKKRKKKS